MCTDTDIHIPTDIVLHMSGADYGLCLLSTNMWSSVRVLSASVDGVCGLWPREPASVARWDQHRTPGYIGWLHDGPVCLQAWRGGPVVWCEGQRESCPRQARTNILEYKVKLQLADGNKWQHSETEKIRGPLRIALGSSVGGRAVLCSLCRAPLEEAFGECRGQCHLHTNKYIFAACRAQKYMPGWA